MNIKKHIFNRITLRVLVFGFALSFPFSAFSTSLGGTIQINTSESLNSSSIYSDLFTPDKVTVTLNQQSYVTVMYNAAVLKIGCLGTMLSVLNINNTQQAGTEVGSGLAINSSGLNTINYTKQLAAGKYTFNVLHRVDGCSGYWLNRSLTVLIHT